MVFHWSFSDCKSPQISRTLLGIVADFVNTIVWMVSIRPPIYKSSISFSKLFGIIPSAPTTTGITVNLMFHSFLSFLTRSCYLFLFSLSLIFTLSSAFNFFLFENSLRIEKNRMMFY